MQLNLASIIRIIVTLILIALLLAGSTWFYRLQLLDFLDRGQVATHQKSVSTAKPRKTARLESPETEETQEKETTSSKKSSPSSRKTATNGLSVVRINPGGGGAVIAGHAGPNMTVTVTADGEVVGSAKAGSDGDWVLVTPHQFKTKDPKIAFTQSKTAKTVRVAKATTGETTSGAKDKSSPNTHDTNAPSGKTAPAAKTDSADAVSARLVENLEKMVETARRDASAQKSVEKTPQQPVTTTASQPSPQKSDTRSNESPKIPKTNTSRTATKNTSLDDNNHKVASNPHAARKQNRMDFSNNLGREQPKNQNGSRVAEVDPGKQENDWSTSQTGTPTGKTKSVPIPIGFEYRKATLTSEGRKAIDLLSEYLSLKKYRRVVLTGHADERGTQSLNMELSQQRLNTVARYLKNAGFKGELKLIPKGETEPFSGVDRQLFSREELYKLDRRVELVESH